MAMVNRNVSTRWNDTNCQGFAGIQCDEFHTHISVGENAGSNSERNAKYRAYHISSNGYYGYLPVMSETEDYAMDTNDAGAENSMGNGTVPNNVCPGNAPRNVQNVNENVLSVDIAVGNRKRVSGEDGSTMEPKRQRKEEQESVNENDTESSLKVLSEECDLDLVENLLRQTHGCDLYHYYACDL